MSDNSDQSTVLDDDQFKQRRDFLKKAGLGAAGLGLFWVAPKLTSVNSKPAYASVTPPSDPCSGGKPVIGSASKLGARPDGTCRYLLTISIPNGISGKQVSAPRITTSTVLRSNCPTTEFVTVDLYQGETATIKIWDCCTPYQTDNTPTAAELHFVAPDDCTRA